MSDAPTKVLIIDDSAIVRKAVTEQLRRQPGIEVVGQAPDPYVAREMIVALEPDALTLDLEMPRMDGLTFLRKLMASRPIPTVVISSLTPAGCDTAVACLEAGAIHVLAKPGNAYSVGDLAAELAPMLRAATGVKLDTIRSSERARATTSLTAFDTTHRVLAIAASTGGTDALTRVLTPLPRTTPGILITQHMPAGFTKSFADRLNKACEIEVTEAVDGDAVSPGRALLAPGDRHLRLARDGARYVARVVDGPRVKRHRPSAEVLFESVATHAGRNATGVILTGMGDDGCDGMLKMRQAGAVNIAQDEATCVVFGMPGAAIKAGGVDEVLPIDSIPQRVLEIAAEKQQAA